MRFTHNFCKTHTNSSSSFLNRQTFLSVGLGGILNLWLSWFGLQIPYKCITLNSIESSDANNGQFLPQTIFDSLKIGQLNLIQFGAKFYMINVVLDVKDRFPLHTWSKLHYYIRFSA